MSMISPAIASISSIDFGCLGDHEIKEQSHVMVTSQDTFASDKTPKIEGILDAHLGTIDYAYNCHTCKNNRTLCPGHKGHMKLNFPVFNPLFIDTVVKWLKIVCHNCKQLIRPSANLDNINFAGKRCNNCSAIQPKINKGKPPMWLVFRTAESPEGIRMYPYQIRPILEGIPESLLKQLKVPLSSHPSKFIISNITVTSVVTRPDVKKIGGGSRSSNDKVTTYFHLIANKNLKLPLSIPQEIPDKLDKEYKTLSFFYYNCVKGGMAGGEEFNITMAASPTREEGARDAILRHLVSKAGHIRGNMLGKPTFYMMRSVITGDPTIKVDELIIPFEFAQIVQFPETVQPYNYDILLTYFLNGKSGTYPRCVKIDKKATGSTHYTNRLPPDVKLEIGDVVWRDLIDGDEVIFNRQPSLYYASMNKHKIRVSLNPEAKTFRMSEVACAPYGADFDGDMMNAVVTPSVAARTEINEMSSMANWTTSYQRSAPHFKPIQDSVLGGYQLTKNASRLDKYHAMRFFSNTVVKPSFGEYPKDHVFTGREVVSMALPVINYTGRTKYYNDNFKPYMNYDMTETKIVIDHGQMRAGVFDKNADKVYAIIEHEHGSRQSLDAMFNIQQLAISYINVNGFTAGIGDLTLPKETFAEMHGLISKVIAESNFIADRLIRREIIPPLGYTTEQYYENLQTAILKQDCVEPIMKAINPETNGIFTMVVTGSKGEWANFQHILAWVGQVLVNGRRVPQNFSYRRTSPFHPRFDTDPESRGFVPNSYITGLEVPQFLFASMAARIDLISKSLGTAVSGAQSRISVKNLEPIIISNNRFAEKTEYIVQFAFGDDGIDPRRVENVAFPTVMISDSELESNYHHVSQDKALKAIFDSEYNTIVADRNTYRRNFMYLENMAISQLLSSSKMMPINVKRIYDDIVHEHAGAKIATDDATLAQMVKRVREFCDNLPYVFMNEIQERKKGYIQPYHRQSLNLLCMYIRSILHSGNMSKITPEMLEAILLKCRLKLLNSLIEYGSPIGLISAVCMSEPTTQLSLKSIHLRDSDTTSQKTGIWRIKEILAVRPTEVCFEPMMTMELKPGTTIERAREIANNIEIMELGKFVQSWQIFFEDYANPVHPDYQGDRKIFEEFGRLQSAKPPSDLLKWCTRFVLDRYSMIFKNMTLEVIVNKLRAPGLFIVHSNENAAEIVVRVYYRSGNSFKATKDVRAFTESLMKLNVRGIDKVVSAKVDANINRHVVQPDGSLKSQKVLTIVTNGVNLRGIFALQNTIPEINYATLQTDAIRDTERTFGIEVARQKIVTELRGVLSELNDRHYTLFADEMTALGRVTAIERSALALRNSNPLLQMANAMPLKVLERSALNNSRAKIDGVSPYLMVGTSPKLGTTYNSFYVNEQFVKENTRSVTSMLDEL